MIPFKLVRPAIFVALLLMGYAGTLTLSGSPARIATSIPDSSRIYAIQIAASKVFIQPDLFKKRFKIDGEVRFIKKDGWYKYVTGSFASEQEAERALSAMGIDAFVTSLNSNWLSPSAKDKPEQTNVTLESLTSADSTGGQVKDTLVNEAFSSEASGGKVPLTYNQLIIAADSVFNKSRDLVEARKLYVEASKLAPDRNYPKDQILEIDKQLAQRASGSFFSTWLKKEYIIWGLASLLGIVLAIILVYRFLVWWKHRLPRRKPENADEPALDFLYDDLRLEQKKKLELIRYLLPMLERELSLEGDPGDTESAIRQISVCLNSPNDILRMEAIQALMLLDPGKPFGFLDKLDMEFTTWAQLQCIELARRNRMTLPDFRRWLESPNPSVADFCRRMLGEGREQFSATTDDLTVQEAAGHLLYSKIR